MSSAISDSGLGDLRSNGKAAQPLEEQRGEDQERTEPRAVHHRRETHAAPRPVRNVRPLPVEPPPRVIETEPEVDPAAQARLDKQEAERKAAIAVQARRASSILHRRSRVRGVGTVVTLITGMCALIILGVALLFALNSEPEATPGKSAPAVVHVTKSAQKPAPSPKAASPSRTSRSNSPATTSGVNSQRSAAQEMAPAEKDVANDSAADSSSAKESPFQEDGRRNGMGFGGGRLNANAANGNDVGQEQFAPGQAMNGAAVASLPTGHIMDDGDAKLTGDWNIADRSHQEHSGARYHGEGFRIDHGTFGERAAAQYIFPPLRPGNYRVWVSYPAAPNRASNVTVVVIDAEGRHEVEIDQTVPPERGKFLEIGDFRLDASQPLVVRFDNEGNFGYLAIDAVKAENLDVPAADANGADTDDAADNRDGN